MFYLGAITTAVLIPVVYFVVLDRFADGNPSHNIGVDPKVAIDRVTEVLSIVGLDADVLERYPHQFSGGQRQRLCLARAIVMEPDVLIADESVSALDVLVQEQVLKLLVDIKRKTGVAILFITHDLRVAAQISDRIVVMQKGRIVHDSTTQEFRSDGERGVSIGRAVISLVIIGGGENPLQDGLVNRLLAAAGELLDRLPELVAELLVAHR